MLSRLLVCLPLVPSSSSSRWLSFHSPSVCPNLRASKRTWSSFRHLPSLYRSAVRVDDVREGLSGFSPFALPSIHSLSIAGVIHTHTHILVSSYSLLFSASLSTQRDSGSWHVGFDSIWYRVIVAFFSLLSSSFFFSPFILFFALFPFFIPTVLLQSLGGGLALPWLPGRPSSRGQASIDSVYSPTSITTWTAFYDDISCCQCHS